MRTVTVFALMILCSVVGNLLMKRGATATPAVFGIASWATIVGLGSFLTAGLLYSFVLRWLPLNVAQAFAAVQFVAVILASTLILHEPIPGWRWVGILLIATGIAITALTQNPHE